ncbi:hypothetical protein ACHAQA_008597 [Verticillium albo-atrum]
MAHGTKVRTGCLTCKKRKVKCDEAKPACSRCTTTGRKCAGYELEYQKSPQERSLAWYRPHQLIAHDQREGRAFQYFSRVVGPVLSGPQDAYFWTHLVMQFGHFAPAVRHAVLAISCLHEDFQNGRRISLELPANPFAIKHYNASIRHIQAARDENLVLLTCVLYLCVAYLLGDMDSVGRHCSHGVAILSEIGCSGWTRDYILPIFRRLMATTLSRRLSGRGEQPVAMLDFGIDDTSSQPFASVSEAEASLCDLRFRARDLGPAGPKPREPSPHCTKGLEAYCNALLDRWIMRAMPLIHPPPESSADRYLLCHCRATYEMLRIHVDLGSDLSEMAFDNHIGRFQTMVALAEEAAEIKASRCESTERQRACFTFEPGFLLPITFASGKCRDLPTRLRALTLMGSLTAAKEGLADVGTLYRIGRRAIEFEHGMSLEDCIRAVNQHQVSYVPEAFRICAVDFDHSFRPGTGPDGEILYRRLVNLIVRTPEGTRVAASEYITDDIPGHCPGIPNIRSALAKTSE